MKKNRREVRIGTLLLAGCMALSAPLDTFAAVYLDEGETRLFNDLFGRESSKETIFENITSDYYGEGFASKASASNLKENAAAATDSDLRKASDSDLATGSNLRKASASSLRKASGSDLDREEETPGTLKKAAMFFLGGPAEETITPVEKTEVPEEIIEEVLPAAEVIPAVQTEEIGQFAVTSDSAENYSFGNGILTVNGGRLIISSIGDTHTDRIIIADDAEVTLDNVTVTADSGAALYVEPAAEAEIILEGDNTLTGAAGYAALEVGYVSGSEMADLTLSGDGSLTASGGSKSAGIGGSKSGNNSGVYGNITIESGSYNLNGSDNAAGLGSSDNPANGTSSGSYKFVNDQWGTITINGGDINAKGAGSGTGIGGGNHSDSGKIIINGGNIRATGHAGIGAGLGSNKPGSGSTKGPGYYFADVTINGGTVYAAANSGANGAGIGGGMYSDAIVTINGGKVTAIGNTQSDNYHHGGAGIGGGYLGHGEIVINGGTVDAQGGGSAAGIGAGGSANGNDTRGSSSRKGETTVEKTSVAVTGGSVNAAGGPKGGAGIGGGAGADEVIVTITGGNVKAYGAESAEDIMEGGAGIGSGSNAKDITKETKYMVDTDTDIEITGGNILAVGGWGAAGIGSGANNVMADTISVSGADVEAYADGTKFAIDTRLLLEDGMTESREDGRNVDGNIFQGTFVHRYTHTCDDEEVTENAEGLRSFDIIGNDSGSIRTLTGMPAKYRSFAATVKSAGLHSVYTREASIGNGNGRYFGTTAKDIWAAEEMNETDVEYTVTGSVLSDNFYLCPVTAAPAERVREEEQEVETPAEEVKQEEIPEETPVEEVKQEEVPEVKPEETPEAAPEVPEVKQAEAPKAAPAAEEAKQAEAPKAETPAEKTAKAEAPAAKADREADTNETVTKAAEPHTTVLYSTNLNEQEESIPEGEVLGAAREIVNETRGTVRRGGNEKAVLGAARGMTATGDSSRMVLWAVMMMMAAAGLLTLIRRRRAAR